MSVVPIFRIFKNIPKYFWIFCLYYIIYYLIFILNTNYKMFYFLLSGILIYKN